MLPLPGAKSAAGGKKNKKQLYCVSNNWVQDNNLDETDANIVVWFFWNPKELQLEVLSK